MQYIFRFKIKPHKSEGFRDWLRQNDNLLKEEMPEGWQYLGTWFTVRGFGRYDAEMRYEIGDYADLGAGFGGEALQKAWVEISDSFVPDQTETYLMKSSEDVLIMEGM